MNSSSPQIRQGSNHSQGWSSSGYGDIFDFMLIRPCSHQSHHVTALLGHPQEFSVTATSTANALARLWACHTHLLLIPLNRYAHFCVSILLRTFSSFLKMFPSFHSGLPNLSQILPPLSNSPWWPCLMLVPLPCTLNTSASLSHRVQQHSIHTDLHSFFKASKLRSFKLNHGGND